MGERNWCSNQTKQRFHIVYMVDIRQYIEVFLIRK